MLFRMADEERADVALFHVVQAETAGDHLLGAAAYGAAGEPEGDGLQVQGLGETAHVLVDGRQSRVSGRSLKTRRDRRPAKTEANGTPAGSASSKSPGSRQAERVASAWQPANLVRQSLADDPSWHESRLQRAPPVNRAPH